MIKTEILQLGTSPSSGAAPATGLSTRIVEQVDQTIVQIIKAGQVVFSAVAYEAAEVSA